ncbi:hypothetical protein CEXT_761641 [Caerostris extrusa]|uniref:Reverse transcriptase domain-containing protein n=1 Tax=Caerostris extrusa TaxID=172846 RepID=A0AAV4UIB3_CAEEX|nr:hypothetical protein CEXT_761641 [Caerostris extrusa]
MHLKYKINRGCPQGSCSGPLFWNLIADDALNLQLPLNCKLQAYADDLVLVVWAKDKSNNIQPSCLSIRFFRPGLR